MKFRKFIPFWKVDEATREVYGIVTAELPDKTDEVCDYATTLPYYKALADEMGKASDGQNICPLREMHQSSAVGKGISFEPHDAEKEIVMRFKVVDDNAWKKVTEKVYTGFSQGGNYIKKWFQDGLTYYTADPVEVSLVDNPCLGAARFYIKSNGAVELQKLGGTSIEVAKGAQDSGDLYETVKLMNRIGTNLMKGEQSVASPSVTAEIEAILKKHGVIKEPKARKVAGEILTADCFAYVPDAEKPETWGCPIKFTSADVAKAEIRRSLSHLGSACWPPEEAKAAVKVKLIAAAKAAGIEVTDASREAVKTAVVKVLPAYLAIEPAKTKLAGKSAADVAKGMYSVAQLGVMLEDLSWMVASTEYEREREQDESPVPDDLRSALEGLIPIFIAMATEEATELTQPAKAAGDTMSKELEAQFAKFIASLQKMTPEDLEKAAKSIHECLDGMHKAVTDNAAAMDSAHKAHAEKCCKACGDHMAAMHGHIEKVRKSLGAGAPEEQNAGGSVNDKDSPAKAAAAEALKKAEEEKAAAEALKKANETAAAAAEAAGNKALADALRTMQASLEKNTADNAKLVEKLTSDLAASNAKIEELGKTMPTHGPAGLPFLVGRGEGLPNGGGAGTGTEGNSGL